MRHGCAQGLPASLVVHPARHSDMQIKRQIVLELGSASREAMRKAAEEDAAKIPEDGRKITVCIALMKKDRLARRGRELQLRDKGCTLRAPRREITVIVQTAFADRNHLRPAQEAGQLAAPRRVEALCMMRVYAGGAGQTSRVCGCERRRPDKTRPIGGGEDLAAHARLARGGDHR